MLRIVCVSLLYVNDIVTRIAWRTLATARDCIGEEGDAAGAEETQWATAEGGTLTMQDRASVGLI